MKYLVDIPSRQGAKIQKFLEDGKYISVSEFVVTAIENQIQLEDNPEIIALTTQPLPTPVQSLPKGISEFNFPECYKYTHLPNIYSVLEFPLFDNLVLRTQNINEEKTWLWGQINKILPVKIGLRILHKNLATNQKIDLNDFLEEAAIEAAKIGRIIREYETKHQKSRDEKITAGLPTIDDEKSQTRYKFQFLAYQRKDGLLDGAMALMRFCNVIIDKKTQKPQIGLTEAGLKFSTIKNPVLDDNNLDLSLSDQEIQFYLTHIKTQVRSEYVAVSWILDMINKGYNETTQLNSELAKTFGETWKSSEAVINTQRAGLTARVYELKLIEKEKAGIHVTYRLSDSGKTFLNSK
jgi:hypothetical protein